MKKLPNGISNYEELVRDGYTYVDKTMYIEKLENLTDKRIMFLRPRKFGKTLFTSVLENYYDIQKAEKFEALFGETYIGGHPTKNKNTYHIVRFNFSGIDTETIETTIAGFNREVASSIEVFVKKYGLDFYVNKEDEAENILDNLVKAFQIQKAEEKIYVMIDEYDHFANELLGFHTEHFKELVSKNGKVRKWYEILKKGTETVIDRIFITGVAPITLDSLTSGFNISNDITQDVDFNGMMGFTKEELLRLMEEQEISKQEQEKILPIMKENYDGYGFSINAQERLYNSNMCLYFLARYTRFHEIPEKLIDANIASDYSKLGKMLELCYGEQKTEMIEKTIEGEGIVSKITEKFNPAMEFTQTDMVSMLYYLGYLTIQDTIMGMPRLTIPNKVMKELYAEYFLETLRNSLQIVNEVNYAQISSEMGIAGRIEKLIETVEKYLQGLSNRDYQRFEEKYIKLIVYCIVMNCTPYRVKSEIEVGRRYPDLLLIPKEEPEKYYSILLEFKYLKKEQEAKREDKQKEARQQIIEYSQMEEIQAIPKLKKYTIVAVNDKMYVEEIS